MTFRVVQRTFSALLLLTPLVPVSAQTAPAKLTIDASSIVTPVSPMLYGLMTEEINHSYDGGLYAEMVDNRTFRAHWDGVGNWGIVRNGNARASFSVDKNDGPSQALPTSLKLTTEAASPGNEAGLSNSGYWGMAVRPHTKYSGSLYAKVGDTNPGPITAALISNDTGRVLASASHRHPQRRLVALRIHPHHRRSEALRGKPSATDRCQTRHSLVAARFALPANL